MTPDRTALLEELVAALDARLAHEAERGFHSRAVAADRQRTEAAQDNRIRLGRLALAACSAPRRIAGDIVEVGTYSEECEPGQNPIGALTVWVPLDTLDHFREGAALVLELPGASR